MLLRHEMLKLGSRVLSPDSGGKVLAISRSAAREEGAPLETAGYGTVL